MKPRKLDVSNCTLIELAYARTGSMLKAARVVAFVVAWGQARDAAGGPITVDDYAAYWKESRSTAFRHRGEFRDVFPNLDTPEPIIELWERERAAAHQKLDLSLVAA